MPEYSEERIKYLREWRRKNKDKIKIITKKCYEKHKKEYRDKSRDRMKKYVHTEKYKRWRRKYRLKNKEKIKKQQKSWYSHQDKKKIFERIRINSADKKFTVLAVYSDGELKCACSNCYYHINDCPIEFLTIDHIHGHGNEHRKKMGFKGGSDFYRWLIKNNFPEGFQVLCMNCNWGKRINKEGVCPHKLMEKTQKGL